MHKYSIIIMAGISVLLSLVNKTSATTYDYDSLNRLVRVTYDSGFQIRYTYDEVGNRTQRVATLRTDLSADGKTDFADFAVLAANWKQANCGEPDFCNGADLDGNSQVDIIDLALLAQHWLEGVTP